jgi:flagellar biosynthesis protein FliQ
MNKWLGAALAVAAGGVIGVISSRIVVKVLARSKVAALRESSTPLAGLALSLWVIVGLLVALGFIAEDELTQLGNDAIAFLPKLIAALVILIGSNVASTFAAAAVERSLAGTGAAARFAPIITKFGILSGGAIVAAGQTGVDTTIVNIAAGALLFGIAATVALLTGLGGRQVSGEIAAGRAWRTVLQTGDSIETIVGPGTRSLDTLGRAGTDGDAAVAISGVVVEVHPTAVELSVSGATVFVPNSRLLDSVVARDRPDPADAAASLERR